MVQYTSKENEKGYGGCLKAQIGTRRSTEVKESLKEGQNPSLTRVLYERRGNRGSVTIGEAPDSVRGVTRVQYPSRVNGKGYGW